MIYSLVMRRDASKKSPIRAYKIAIFFLLLALIFPLTASAQLTPDQDALLEDVLTAFERREAWERYSQFSENTVNTALTISGTDILNWKTQNFTLNGIAQIDREAEVAQGEISVLTNEFSADQEPTITDQTLNFLAQDDEVLVQSASDAAFNAADETEYAALGLPELADFDKRPDPIGWLEDATAIYDLGVRRGVQYYDLELDFNHGLPYVGFEIDTFLEQFNGMVELGALTQAVGRNGTLALQVGIDVRSGQLVSITSLIEIAVEIDGADVVAVPNGDGVFQLEYARQVETTYYDVGVEFEIQAP